MPGSEEITLGHCAHQPAAVLLASPHALDKIRLGRHRKEIAADPGPRRASARFVLRRPFAWPNRHAVDAQRRKWVVTLVRLTATGNGQDGDWLRVARPGFRAGGAQDWAGVAS